MERHFFEQQFINRVCVCVCVCVRSKLALLPYKTLQVRVYSPVTQRNNKNFSLTNQKFYDKKSLEIFFLKVCNKEMFLKKYIIHFNYFHYFIFIFK